MGFVFINVFVFDSCFLERKREISLYCFLIFFKGFKGGVCGEEEQRLIFGDWPRLGKPEKINYEVILPVLGTY